MRLIAVLSAAVLAALVVAAPAGAARRSVPASFFGVNWDQEIAASGPGGLQNQQFGRMAAAGAETVRGLFLWSTAQPDQNGPIDFSATDQLVGGAAAHHLTVLPIVVDSPLWARAFESSFSPPSNPQDYAAYLTALIGRYGPHGSFWRDNPRLPKVPVRAWQIWNEPNMSYQWSTPGSTEDYAVRYTMLLRDSYQAIKRADPGALVVLAGLANTSPQDLAHLYDYGAKPYFDVAAIHPYTYTPAGVLTLTREARQVMRRNGDNRKQLWVTELGLPASRGVAQSSNSLQTTPAGMTRFLTNAYRLLAGNARRLGIGRVYWYTWASSYSSNAGPAIFDFSGLFKWTPGSPVVAREPAYAAYVRAARHWEGCVKTTMARCKRTRRH